MGGSGKITNSAAGWQVIRRVAEPGSCRPEERDHQGGDAFGVLEHHPVAMALEQFDLGRRKRLALTLGLFAGQVRVLGSPR